MAAALLAAQGFSCISELHRATSVAVFRGRKKDTQEEVILKTRASHPAECNIEHEYELLRRLYSSGATVEPISWFTSDGFDVLVMRESSAGFVPGVQCTREREGLDFRRFFDVAPLGRIHSRHVVHGDVKPSNFLYSSATQVVHFFDFDLAFTFTGASVALGAQTSPRGTFPYIAPECTGRIRARPDHRADLYSLGIALYEIITGSLPFSQYSAIGELLHAIITQVPPSARSIRPSVSPTLAAIIDKLLAKDPNQRYQSCYGLYQDLKRCQAALSENCMDFTLGGDDVNILWRPPRQMYGREKELQAAKNLFDQLPGQRVCALFIGGEPGSGKSSFVDRFLSQLNENVLHGSGKFEHSHGQAPYKALVAALSSVLQRINTMDVATKRRSAEHLQATLGSNATLLYPLLPGLKQLLGAESGYSVAAIVDANEELPTQAVQARFAEALLNLVMSCTSAQHPLVLCVDDLQWADPASLAVITQLLSGLQSGDALHARVLFVGAYRTGDAATGTVCDIIARLRSAGLTLTALELTVLGINDVLAMLDDLFPSGASALQALASAVMHKTLGNAFFVLQFLQGLYQDALVRFDFDTGEWTFDMKAIDAAPFTDNVALYLSQRLSHYTAVERHFIASASCFGVEVPREILERVLDVPSDLFNSLVLAFVGENWLLTGNAASVLWFSHDHLRNASYALMSDDQRNVTHLRIAQQLLAAAQKPPTTGELFAIVKHFNRTGSRLPASSHRLVVELNITALKSACTGASYNTAYDLAAAAFRIVERQPDWWAHPSDRDLAWKAALARFVCQGHLSRHADADASYAFLLSKAETEDERVAAWQARASQLELQSRWREALEVLVDCIRAVGFDFPSSPTKEQVDAVINEATQAFVVKKERISSFTPASGRIAIVLSCLSRLMPATFHCDRALHMLATARMVLIVLSSESIVPSFALCLVGMASALIVDHRVDLGMQMSRYAHQLCETSDSPFWKCKVYVNLIGLTKYFDTRFADMIPMADEGIKLGLEAGDTVYVAFMAFQCAELRYLAGNTLSSVASYCEATSKWFVQQSASLPLKRYLDSMFDLVNALTLSSRAPLISRDEAQTLDPSRRGWYWGAQVVQCHLLERYEEAYHAAQNLKECQSFVNNITWTHLYFFHYALCLFALYPSADATLQKSYRQDIDNCKQELAFYAEHAPMNFLAMNFLLEAEYARVLLNNPAEAMFNYDKAVLKAREHKIPVVLGLASELAGVFYLSTGAAVTAKPHLTTAYQTYMEWGAIAKVKALVQRLPFVDFGASIKADSNSFNSSNEKVLHAQVDVESIVKASKVLTAEPTQSGMLEMVMNIITENCAAESHNNGARTESQPQLSQTAIDLSVKEGQVIVSENATMDARFVADKYIHSRGVRSLLCIPIQKATLLVPDSPEQRSAHEPTALGVVYIENNTFSGAFLPARIPVLLTIVSQLAISIENATMVHRLMEYSSELQKRNAELHRLDKIKNEFLATTTHELRTPLNAITACASLLYDTPLDEEQRNHVRTIERSAITQLRLVNDLIDTSKMQAGKLRIVDAPFNLYECIENAFEMVAPMAAEKGLELAYRVDCKIAPSTMLVGDAGRLKQVMVNLLSNAIKFTEEGDVDLAVTSCERMNADAVLLVFEVRDTGIGIPPEKVGELFSLFSQLDSSSTRKYEGSGLGLYLTSLLVKLMNGSISVSSDRTPGSTFSVHVLLRTHSGSPLQQSEAAAGVLAGKRVLVLAASEANRDTFAKLLPSVNATVICVAVARGSSELPATVTTMLLEDIDIVIAELTLVTALQALMTSRILKEGRRRTLIVPLATSLQWSRYQQKQQDLLLPVFKPMSHVSVLSKLAMAYDKSSSGTREKPTAKPRQQSQPVVVSPSPSAAGVGARILVVEDNKVNNQVLCQILVTSNYTVHPVFNGKEALAAMQRESYDLVLMDVFMPVMDGIECTRELRRLGFRCPIIAVSATINEEACLAAGITGLLPKPITKRSVLSAVESYLTPAPH